jgi:hypothetical protein
LTKRRAAWAVAIFGRLAFALAVGVSFGLLHWRWYVTEQRAMVGVSPRERAENAECVLEVSVAWGVFVGGAVGLLFVLRAIAGPRRDEEPGTPPIKVQPPE